MLMLCLGVLAPQADFSWIDPDYGEFASQAGQFAPSLIGAGLVMMAVGLSHRVNLAWGLTIFLLVLGAAFAATQALAGMSTAPLLIDEEWISVPVAERRGAVMEAARRLLRAGVGVHDIVVSTG